MGRVLAASSQKGGVAKSATALHLGVGLAQKGKKVLLVDADPQGSLTISMGWREPDALENTLATYMEQVINEEQINFCPLRSAEGVDLIPGNIELSAVDASLANVMCREQILREVINQIKDQYDYIILDSLPRLGLLALNVMVAADSIIIPMHAAYLSTKGLEQLIKTYGRVKRALNPGLMIDGILFTMVNDRTNNAKQIAQVVREAYGQNIHIFETYIPKSVKVEEASAEGVSIYMHDSKGRVSTAYKAFTEEYLERKGE